ncbi:hypothetical protein [Pendulispora albinea]|uniref:Cytochrome C Planctomycete-type domain-containing protein n=1 Tax=Pendulispora albinea TaxID=2741071 RepID=A0ABZ2M5P8_9BACT
MAFAAAACDQGHQSDQPTAGPYVHLVATNVGSFNGSPEKKLPPDGAVLLSFDRLLLPSTVIRQSIFIIDAFGDALSPTVQYDPVTRIVTLGPPTQGEWLVRSQPYKLVLAIPNGNEDTNGVRAIDRAPLDPTSQRVISFFVSDTPEGLPNTPRYDFCTDVLPIFQRHCSASQCHGSGADGRGLRAATGLVLDTPVGVEATAIGHTSRIVAVTSNTGPRGRPRAPGRQFGVDVPLVDPRAPGNSWLLYKLLIAPPPPPGTPASHRLKCDGSPGTAPQGHVPPPVPIADLSDDERARLSEFVGGNVMPYPPNPGTGDRSENLSFDELQRISGWIDQGAVLQKCACEK